MNLIFKIFHYGLWSFIFFDNLFSLQVPRKGLLFKDGKASSCRGNISKLLFHREIGKREICKNSFRKEVMSWHHNRLDLVKKNFKKVLLLKDSTKFFDALNDVIDVLSALDLAKVFYDIFSDEGEARDSSLIGTNSVNKNIYHINFNRFLKKNRQWSDFKEYFLTKVPDFYIVTYLLNHTFLSYPYLFYVGGDQESLEKSFCDYLVNTSHFSTYSSYPKIHIHVGISLIYFEAKELLFFSFSGRREKQLEHIVKEGILRVLGFWALLNRLTNERGARLGYVLPAFFKLSFPAGRDQLKKIENWMDLKVRNPLVIRDILKELIEKFPLVAAFSKCSKTYRFAIASLWMRKACDEDASFYLIFRIKDSLEGDPFLEFFREEKEIEVKINNFFDRNHYKGLYALMSEFLSRKFPKMQAKDFVQIIINSFKRYFLYFKEGDEIKKSEWKKLVEEEDFGRIKEKMELIYQKLPYDSKEEESLKEDFFRILSSFNNAFSNKMCVDA